ncbi:MAG: hypothetical protein KGM98_03320 [Bacteroidota bacterium]|nr:hypothetical protein [Bacteroidota bacterium]
MNNIDSLSLEFDKYSRAFNLNFHSNEAGKEQLFTFSTNYIGKYVGFFINNKLLSAGCILSSIEKGNMTLQGKFSESELITLKKEIESAMHK